MGYSCRCKQSCFAHRVCGSGIWIGHHRDAVCVSPHVWGHSWKVSRGDDSTLEPDSSGVSPPGADTWGLRWSTSMCYLGLFHVARACSGMAASADHISYTVAQSSRYDFSTGKGRRCTVFFDLSVEVKQCHPFVPWVEAFTSPPIFKWRGMRPPVGGNAHHVVEVHVDERLSHHLGDYHRPWSTEGGSQATGSGGGAWPRTDYLMHLNDSSKLLSA